MKDILKKYASRILVPIIVLPLLGAIFSQNINNVHFIYCWIIIVLAGSAAFFIYHISNEKKRLEKLNILPHDFNCWSTVLPYSVEKIFSQIEYFHETESLNAYVSTIYTIKGLMPAVNNIVIFQSIRSTDYDFAIKINNDWHLLKEDEKINDCKINHLVTWGEKGQKGCRFELSEPLIKNEIIEIRIRDKIKNIPEKGTKEFSHRSPLGVKVLEIRVSINNGSKIKDVNPIVRNANNNIPAVEKTLVPETTTGSYAYLLVTSPISTFDYGLSYSLVVNKEPIYDC